MRTSPFHRFSPLPILFLAVFVDMVGFGIVVPVLPLYTERFGASPITIGALLAVYSGMGFIFAPWSVYWRIVSGDARSSC
jgi:hypothetical protein